MLRRCSSLLSTGRIPPKAQALILASALSFLLTACDNGDGQSADASAADSAAEPAAQAAVTAFETTARKRDLVEPVIGTGTLAAHKTTELGPRVDGIIQEIYVRVGDRVKEGQPLFKTRDVELKLKMQELENQLKLAKAQRTNAVRQHERANELYRREIISEGRLETTEAERDVAAANVGVVEAKVAAARQMLADTVVRAPFDGVITRRDVDEGKFMVTRVPSMGGGGGGVVEIKKIDILGAIVEVPELQLSKIALGTPANIHLDGINETIESEVAVINDNVDPTRRAVEVRLPFRNPDYRIKPGLFARAEIFPPAREILALDRNAVLGPESARYVFVEEDGKAKRVPVKVAQVDATTVEVLAGLDDGDTVLTGPNAALLIEGTPVRIAERQGDTSRAGLANPDTMRP